MSVLVAIFSPSTNSPILVLPEDDEIVLIESWWDPLLLSSLRQITRADLLLDVAWHA